MMSGYDRLNKKRFNSRRKVDSEFAAKMTVGSVFQICGARLPTVDSLTGGKYISIVSSQLQLCHYV